MIALTRTKQLVFFALMLALLALNSADVLAAGSGPLHRDGVVYGVVVGPNGAPLQGIYIELDGETDSDPYYGGYAMTDWQGRYRIEDVPHGNFVVIFSDSAERVAKTYSGNVPDRRNARVVTVSGNQEIEVSAQMQRGGTIRGRLSVDGPLSLTDLGVTLYRWDGVAWERYDGASDYYPDPPFSFHIRNLPAGRYKAEGYATVDYDTSFSNFYPNGTTLADAETITLAETGDVYLDMSVAVTAQTLLSGRVIDAATNQPLHDIGVQVYRLNQSAGRWETVSIDYTDESGRYAFVNLEADNYKLSFYNYSLEQYGTTYNGNQPTLGAAPHIVLGEGQQLTDQDIALRAGGIIYGSVSAADGAPLSGISVEAYRYNGAGNWLKTSYDFVWYDESGFMLQGLPTGHYRLKFGGYTEQYGELAFWYGGAKELEDAAVVDVVAGDSQQLSVTAPGGQVTIIGTVRDKQWNRVSGAQVTVYQLVQDYHNYGYWQAVTSMQSDADGTYRFDGLLPGGYTVSAFDTSGTYLDTYHGNKLALQDAIGFELADGGIRRADFFMAETGSISGQITLANGVIPAWGNVYLLPVDETGQPPYYPHRYVNLNDDGSYRIDNLTPGEYKLYFDATRVDANGDRDLRAFAYSGGVEFVQQAEAIRVAEGQDVAGVSAELGAFYFPNTVRENSISGRVTNGSTPLGGIEVYLYQRSTYRGSIYWPEWHIAVVTTDANGEYQFDDLTGGHYRIGFRDPSGTFSAEYYNSSDGFYQSAIVSLSHGTHATADATLDLAPVSNIR